MKAAWRSLLHPVLWQGMALLVFVFVTWFIGPLIAVGDWRPLDVVRVRAVLVGVATLAVVLLWLRRWRHRQRPVAGHLALPGRWQAWFYGAVGLVCVGTLIACATSYANSRSQISTVAANVAALKAEWQAMQPVASDDIAALVPMLQKVRDLTSMMHGEPSFGSGFGLSQDPRLAASVQGTYSRVLRNVLWPPVARRVEQLVRQDTDDAELRYESLKAYLMLFAPERFDAAALVSFMVADWEASQQRQPADVGALREHLEAMLADGPPAVQFGADLALVAIRRQQLSTQPLPVRVYGRLKRMGVGAEVAPFTALGAAGPAAATAFVRASGRPLSEGIPGLFTRDGYHRGFQRAIGSVASQLAHEQDWVLGIPSGAKDRLLPFGPAMPKLLEDVRRLYLTEYVSVWEAYMVDLRLAQTRSLPELVGLVRSLSGTDGPLPLLLRTMSRETTLIEDKLATSGLVAEARRSLLSAQTKPASPAPPVESIVDDRFEGLRRLLNKPDDRTQARLDHAMAIVDDLYIWLYVLQRGGAAENSTFRPDRVLPLRAEADRMPEPLRSMLKDLAARCESFAGATAKRK